MLSGSLIDRGCHVIVRIVTVSMTPVLLDVGLTPARRVPETVIKCKIRRTFHRPRGLRSAPRSDGTVSRMPHPHKRGSFATVCLEMRRLAEMKLQDRSRWEDEPVAGGTRTMFSRHAARFRFIWLRVNRNHLSTNRDRCQL